MCAAHAFAYRDGDGCDGDASEVESGARVTFEESIEALGLSERLAAREKGPLTEAELRAAYVALIKVHKPERDPEGFRKVREAYECAQQGLRWHALATDPPRGDLGFGSPEFVPELGDAAPRPDPFAEPSPEVQARHDEHAALDAAYRAIDEAKDEDTRIALLRQAVGKFPQEHAFRWQLIDAYDAAEKRDLADEVLAEGVALDLPAFLETYALEAPGLITGAQLEKLRARKATRVVLRVAIAQGREPLFRETLQSAMEEGPHKQPRMPYIDLALFALQRQASEYAVLLLAAIKEHGGSFALEPRAQVAEVFTRDLLALRNDVPLRFFQAFIEGVKLGRANHEVSVLAAENPEQARRVLAALKRHSEALTRAYEPMLSRRAEAAPPAPAKFNWHWGWVLLASGLVRACMAANRNSDSNASSSYALQRALDERIEERQRQWPEEETRGYEDGLAERLSELDRRAQEQTEAESPESAFIDSTAPTPEQVHAAVMVICQEAGTYCEAAELLERNAARGHCDLTVATEFAEDTRGLSPEQEFLLVRQAALAACVLDTAQP